MIPKVKRKNTPSCLSKQLITFNSMPNISEILDILPEAAFAINVKGEVIAWNLKMELITGVERAEMLGKGNYEYSQLFYGVRCPSLLDMILEHNLRTGVISEPLSFDGIFLSCIDSLPLIACYNGSLVLRRARCLTNDSHEIIGAIELWSNESSEAVLDQFLRPELNLNLVQPHGECDESKIEDANFQMNIIDLATRFFNIPLENVEACVAHAMATVGGYAGAQSSHLYIYDNDKRTYSHTYDWCTQSVHQHSLNEEILMQLKYLSSNGEVFCLYTNKLSDDGNLRQLLENADIGSLAVIPLQYSQKCLGHLSFESDNPDKIWRENEQWMFRVLGELFTNVEIRRRNEHELITARNDALSANLAKSTFLADMSHEIRTPLNGIIGILDLISNSGPNPEHEGYLQKAIDASNLLMQLINDIIDLSKVEAGHLTIEQEVFSIRKTVEDSIAMFSMNAHEKGLALHTWINRDIPEYLIGDAVRIKQIVNNLLSNALKFTHSGMITVHLDLINRGTDWADIEFKVSDTGIGMTHETIEKIFQPFVQADSSTTRLYGGSGLGLSISQKIIHALGSKIQVLSTPGLGSIFYFTIRFNTYDSRIAHELNSRIGKTSIILASIQPSERNYLKFLLENIHCSIIETENIRQMVELLVVNKDIASGDCVIIFQNHLSDLSGQDIKAIIRGIPSIQHHPLILISDDVCHGDDHATNNLIQIRSPANKLSLYTSINTCLNKIQLRKSGHASSRHLPKQPVPAPSILVAEDNEMNRMVFTRYLLKLGIKCDVALNGQQAIEAAREKHYDIIFMDCQMPIIDGFQATRLIKELPNSATTHVIAVTAGAMGGDQEKSFEAGMDAYLSKPVNSIAISRMLYKFYWSSYIVEHSILPECYCSAMELFLMNIDTNFPQAMHFYCEFKDHLSDIIAEMDKHVAAQEFAQIQYLAHQLKGAALNLYLHKLVSFTQKTEYWAEKKNPRMCKVYIGNIKNSHL